MSSGEDKNENFLQGLTVRSMISDCPLGAFKVTVQWCEGNKDCVSSCMVKVFSTDAGGRCIVINDDLCFGCMACVAQCQDEGVRVVPREPPENYTVKELLE